MKTSHINGLGGTFIYTRTPKDLADWYARHLALRFENHGDSYYTTFVYRYMDTPQSPTCSVFSVNPYKGEADPIPGNYMVNFRVNDLHLLVAELKASGQPVSEVEEHVGMGLFAWVTDPEGNRVELWQDGFDYTQLLSDSGGN